MDELIQVESGAVRLALGRFALSLKQRAALLKVIGQGQLVSIFRTFDEQGTPANSWAPLAPSTIRNKRSKATAGRKILILSGRLRNSVHAEVVGDAAVVGTNLPYARVQQEGSADMRGAAIGPQARIAGRSSAPHSRKFLREIHYSTRQVMVDGKAHQVPVGMRTGIHEVTDKNGRDTKVKAKYQGPRHQQDVQVGERFGGIRPRPYLVFRPEDEPRIRGQVIEFTSSAAVRAGLQVEGGQ